MLFSLSRFGLLRPVLAAAVFIAIASFGQANERVTKEQILKEWERTVIDPVTVEFTVERYLRPSIKKRTGDNDPFGDNGPFGPSAVDANKESARPQLTKETWRLTREKGRGMRLERIAPVGKLYVVHGGKYFSLYGSFVSDCGRTVYRATRNPADSEMITPLLTVGLVLDWLDPLATANGQRFFAMTLDNIKPDASGDTVSVTVDDRRTITLSRKHNWRSVRELSGTGRVPMETVYTWGSSENFPLMLNQVVDIEDGGPKGKFDRIVLKIDSISQAAIPDSAFTLEFPPGTVIRDSVNSSNETEDIFLVTFDGVERHLSEQEQKLGHELGEDWVDYLSRNSPPAQLQQNGTRYVFWGVMITVICVGLVFLARKVRYAYR